MRAQCNHKVAFWLSGPAIRGSCARCRAGQTHTCETQSTLIGWNRDGGYAQALAVPGQCLLPVPDDIPDDLAPLLLEELDAFLENAA